MTVHVVLVPHVVHLEAERMLQVVARLLIAQPGHDSGPLADVYYLYALHFRQRAGHLVNLVRRRYRCALRHRLTWPAGQISHSSLMP